MEGGDGGDERRKGLGWGGGGERDQKHKTRGLLRQKSITQEQEKNITIGKFVRDAERLTKKAEWGWGGGIPFSLLRILFQDLGKHKVSYESANTY